MWCRSVNECGLVGLRQVSCASISIVLAFLEEKTMAERKKDTRLSSVPESLAGLPELCLAGSMKIFHGGNM